MGLCGAKQKLLSQNTQDVLKAFFASIDSDGDLVISKAEAIKFWSSRFAKVNAENFFNEVDEDKDDKITQAEFIEFWQSVRDKGYEESEIVEEIKDMIQGEAWKGWAKNKETGSANPFGLLGGLRPSGSGASGERRPSGSAERRPSGSANPEDIQIPQGVRLSRRDSKS
mmetsp:Transcript_6350/g.18880  ORF Transcript_6350/g.18880 Transcript_6350/m.18880 type:complete len:169 (+) Transcript_6350:109-615(+)